MADDLDDDDYYLQQEIVPESNDLNEKKVEKKKTKQKKLSKKPIGTYSDLISIIRTHYKKSKSQYELSEILSIFNSSISASCPSISTILINQYLNELISFDEWIKKADLSSAPIVIIIAQSALRCIELGKMLKNSSSSKLLTSYYLFAKHKKLSQQIEYLNKSTTIFNIIIGTPKRINDILDRSLINCKRLKFILIDWNYRNIKQQRLIDLNQLKIELCHLLCEQKILHKRFFKQKTKIGLY